MVVLMIPVHLTRHAQQQMTKRGIPTSAVYGVLDRGRGDQQPDEYWRWEMEGFIVIMDPCNKAVITVYECRK